MGAGQPRAHFCVVKSTFSAKSRGPALCAPSGHPAWPSTALPDTGSPPLLPPAIPGSCPRHLLWGEGGPHLRTPFLAREGLLILLRPGFSSPPRQHPAPGVPAGLLPPKPPPTFPSPHPRAGPAPPLAPHLGPAVIDVLRVAPGRARSGVMAGRLNYAPRQPRGCFRKVFDCEAGGKLGRCPEPPCPGHSPSARFSAS